MHLQSSRKDTALHPEAICCCNSSVWLGSVSQAWYFWGVYSKSLLICIYVLAIVLKVSVLFSTLLRSGCYTVQECVLILSWLLKFFFQNEQVFNLAGSWKMWILLARLLDHAWKLVWPWTIQENCSCFELIPSYRSLFYYFAITMLLFP